MKKIILTLLVLAIAITSAFSAFIEIGPTATIENVDLRHDDLSDLNYTEFSNYRYGMDARINILHVAAHVSSFYVPATDKNPALFDTSLYGIVNFELFDGVSFGFGPGLNYDVNPDKLPKDYKEVILDGHFEAKTHLSVAIDDTVLTAYYVLPTNYQFAGGRPSNGVLAWDRGYIGFSVLLGF